MGILRICPLILKEQKETVPILPILVPCIKTGGSYAPRSKSQDDA